MHKPRVAILASGGGSTTEKLIIETIQNNINCKVALVISNNEDAGVFEKVNKLNKEHQLKIKKKHIGSLSHPDKNVIQAKGKQTKNEETAILESLLDNKIEIVMLLGYMKKVGARIVNKYGWSEAMDSPFACSMLNTHPGTLPLTKGLFGLNVQTRTLKLGVEAAGHCIFAVANEYDDGPIITEHQVEILSADTPDSLLARVQASEKRYLADDMNYFVKNWLLQKHG